MYIRRQKGPLYVTLPDGTKLTRSDLPPKSTRRWVARRKACVVMAVNSGLLDEEEACEMYGLSLEELQSWCSAMQSHGPAALKATAVQRYRNA